MDFMAISREQQSAPTSLKEEKKLECLQKKPGGDPSSDDETI